MKSFVTSTEHTAATAATIDAMRPTRLAPLHRRCDLCDSGIGAQVAVIDAPTIHGPWAYLCLTHAATHCRPYALKIGTRLLAEPTVQADWHTDTSSYEAPASPVAIAEAIAEAATDALEANR